jgi:hypothetical protein
MMIDDRLEKAVLEVTLPSPVLAVRCVCSACGNSVRDPDVFGPPGSGSTSQRYGSGSGTGSFIFPINVLSGLKRCLIK